jgi:FeS assembly SUF system protein
MGLRTRIKSKGLKVAKKFLGHIGRGESNSEVVSDATSTVQASELQTEEPTVEEAAHPAEEVAHPAEEAAHPAEEVVAHTLSPEVDTPSEVDEAFMTGNDDIKRDTHALEEELAQAEKVEASSEVDEGHELGPEDDSTTDFTSTEEKKTEWPPKLEGAEVEAIRAQVIENIQTIFDPEIPVNIYELGLIYEVNIHEGMAVNVIMTLTSPNCPAAQSLPLEVKIKTEDIEKVASAEVDIVWDPVWGPHLMSEAARLELNL